MHAAALLRWEDMLRPNRWVSSLLVVSLLAGLPAFARQVQVGDVRLPEEVTVADQHLRLNGAGEQKLLFLELYTLGLYLEEPTHSVDQVLASEQVKRLHLVVERSLPRALVIKAFRDGLTRNVPEEKRAEVERYMPQVLGALRDVKRGDELLLTYTPGKGATMQGTNQPTVEVPSKDFANALFSIWLGPNVNTGGLKRELLGG